jgi:hypothetical protein
MGLEVLSVTRPRKQKAPAIAGASCRPRIPSPLTKEYHAYPARAARVFLKPREEDAIRRRQQAQGWGVKVIDQFGRQTAAQMRIGRIKPRSSKYAANGPRSRSTHV